MTIYEQLQALPRNPNPGPLDMGELMRLMNQIRREREITATERMMMNSTVTTTVYSGPGYPIDPRMEGQRITIDTEYSCVMIGPTVLHGECVIESFSDPTEHFIESAKDPKDLAAVRRIIANWECPEEMSATEYINSRQPYGGFNPMNSRRSLSPANFRSSYDI